VVTGGGNEIADGLVDAMVVVGRAAVEVAEVAGEDVRFDGSPDSSDEHPAVSTTIATAAKPATKRDAFICSASQHRETWRSRSERIVGSTEVRSGT